MARDGLEIVVEALQLRSSYLALDPLEKVMSKHKHPYGWLDSPGRSGIKVGRTENLRDPLFAQMRGREHVERHRRLTRRHMSWGRAFRWVERGGGRLAWMSDCGQSDMICLFGNTRSTTTEGGSWAGFLSG